MSFLTIVGVAVGLAMDATAVALATSVTLGRVTRGQVFRFAFHFGLFQALMPVVGWLAGRQLYAQIAPWAPWVAFVLLAAIGVKALHDARGPVADASDAAADPTRGLSLVALSVATSIDALAVGLSFAVLGVTIWYPAVVIGMVTAALTAAAMVVGSRLGARFGPRLRIAGGVVLIALGVQILGSHLWG